MPTRFLILLLALLAVAPAATAGPITVLYQGNIIEGDPGVDQGLPFMVGGFCACLPNNLRLKFFVPDYLSLLSISSINVRVNVFDDDDRADNEEGELKFVLNGVPLPGGLPGGLPNVTVASFSGLNGTIETAPKTVAGSVNPGDLADALLEIQQDGIFFIRVNRDGGDFLVGKDPVVEIDGALAAVPEPATFALFAAGLAGVAAARRRARLGSPLH